MQSGTSQRLCAGILLLAVCLAGVGLAYRGGPIGIDQPVMTWMAGHQRNSLVPLVSALSDVFSPIAVVGWTVLIAVALFIRDRAVGRPLAIIGAVATAGVVTEIVKLVVARPRPPMAYHAGVSEMTYSYPSAHVTGTTALTVTAALIVSAGAHRYVRAVALGLATAISVLAAATRLYLGVHWCSDVVAAFAVGVASALVVPAAADALMNDLRRRRPAGLPQWFTSPSTSSTSSTKDGVKHVH
ncbi:phosphatase PAP2 family protein [Gordonia sp. DT30]|uniref:phosphatase PAP2 family protein n=1 Tax=unclassified Gordonia (in: high G+C Gram-positive bacteria) TaxID=2657482 RepID=UPI003CF7D6C0